LSGHDSGDYGIEIHLSDMEREINLTQKILIAMVMAL
jgi:hypothetical protein